MRLNSASEPAFTFGKKASLWGRLFSILDWVPKVFPNWSEYNMCRETSMVYYDCMKVLQKLSYCHVKICDQGSQYYRPLSMSNMQRSTKTTSDISWTNISSRWKTLKMIRPRHSAVSRINWSSFSRIKNAIWHCKPISNRLYCTQKRLRSPSSVKLRELPKFEQCIRNSAGKMA